MSLNIIITGATGMVGEGVLLECLDNPAIGKVLLVNRKHFDLTHPKLTELIAPDFMNLEAASPQLAGYDGCFFCAGISSVGMKEPEYRHITYDVTLNFARTLAKVNPAMVFVYVSGAHTDSTEKGKVMWARVKGKTENELLRLPFRKVYNFRPGLMKPFPGQKNVKSLIKVVLALFPLLKVVFPKSVSTMRQVGRAMINSVVKGHSQNVLEVADINSLSGE